MQGPVEHEKGCHAARTELVKLLVFNDLLLAVVDFLLAKVVTGVLQLGDH